MPAKQNESPALTQEAAAGETTEQPRKKRPVLDPPYNPVGMAILRNAEYGMSYQGDTDARNKRASRMQAAIVDVQKALNPENDPNS